MAERTMKGPRNRPRARLVCGNCRARKIKCDAERSHGNSRCTPCQASGSRCHIDPDSDRRRHSSSHQKLSEMQQRIHSLEAMIKEKSHVEPEVHDMNDRQHQRRLSQSVSQGSEMSPREMMNPSAQPEHDLPLVTGDTVSHTHVADESVTPCPIQHSTIFSRQSATHLGDINAGATLPDVAQVDDNEAVQIYHDVDTDEIAFYGSTTQPHLHSPIDKVLEHVLDADEEHAIVNIDSSQLRKALLTTFFRIQPCSQVIVHEDLFRQERDARSETKRTRYHSVFLENAMLAAATRHNTSSAVRALGQQYSDRAKSLIAAELEHPKISTLQGFLFLSDFEATRGCARVGWTFCSIAAGLLIDLALHVDVSKYARRGSVSQTEIDFRQTLLLGTFVYTTLWSLYLGRPSSISGPVLSAVQYLAGTAHADRYHYNDNLIMWVRLCLQMLGIIETLNDPTPPTQAEQLLRLHKHEHELQSVFVGLPNELSFDGENLEDLEITAYSPQIQYCGTQITLHKAMAKMSGSEQQNQHTKALDHIYDTIHQNSSRITMLVSSYRRIFGLESMVTVMLDNIYLAAVSLIAHVVRLRQANQPTGTDASRIRFLYQILDSVEKHFLITRRMKSTLMHMVKGMGLDDVLPLLPGKGVDKQTRASIGDSMTPDSCHLPKLIPQAKPITAVQISNDNPDMGIDIDFNSTSDAWMHYQAWNMPFYMPTDYDTSFVPGTDPHSTSTLVRERSSFLGRETSDGADHIH